MIAINQMERIYFDGTSMACPVVAGLAALIRKYYPKLSAGQVKEITCVQWFPHRS